MGPIGPMCRLVRPSWAGPLFVQVEAACLDPNVQLRGLESHAIR